MHCTTIPLFFLESGHYCYHCQANLDSTVIIASFSYKHIRIVPVEFWTEKANKSIEHYSGIIGHGIKVYYVSKSSHDSHMTICYLFAADF